MQKLRLKAGTRVSVLAICYAFTYAYHFTISFSAEVLAPSYLSSVPSSIVRCWGSEYEKPLGSL